MGHERIVKLHLLVFQNGVYGRLLRFAHNVNRAPIFASKCMIGLAGMGAKMNSHQDGERNNFRIEIYANRFRPAVMGRIALDKALLYRFYAAQCLKDSFGAPMAPTAKSDNIYAGVHTANSFPLGSLK